MKATYCDNQRIINYYDSTEGDYNLVLDLKKNLALHYGFWDESVHSLKQALLKENQVLADLVRINSGTLLLDAGCGVGGSAIFLSKTFGCKTIGITLSRRQTDLANQNAKRMGVNHLAKFKTMDFTKTSFRNDSFDVIWAIESVCHANDKTKFTEEAYRILRKGGRIIIADGLFSKSAYKLNEQKLLKQWLNGWGVNSLETPSEFVNKLERVGFKNVSFTNKTRNIIPSAIIIFLWSIPGLIFGRLLELIRLRNKFQSQNILSAQLQFITLIKRLWIYGLIYAEK